MARWTRAGQNTHLSFRSTETRDGLIRRQYLSYVATGDGWLYLAVVMDLASRRIVGWSMNSRITAELVCEALKSAYWRRKPPTGLIMHSDRGSQGGFNRSSQHRVVERILGTRSTSQLVSSRPTFCAACRSRSGPQLESLARSSETG